MRCGKTADRIWMPFGMVGGTALGMRHVVGFGDWSREEVIFFFWGGANLGCAIVTNGDFAERHGPVPKLLLLLYTATQCIA